MQIRLAHVKYFDHGRTYTLWLGLDSDELIKLQAMLVAAFPDCTDLSTDPSRDIAAYTPHLSLGQWRSLADVRKAQQAGCLYAFSFAFSKQL